MLAAYLELGDEAGAEETKAMIESLQKQMEAALAEEKQEALEETKQAKEPEAPKEAEDGKNAVGSGKSSADSGPGVQPRWTGVDGDGQALLDQYLEEALYATARQDFEAAIKAYQEIEKLYVQYGNSDTAIKTDVMIEGLKRLMEESQ